MTDRALERKLGTEEVTDELFVKTDEEALGRHQCALLGLGDQLVDALVLPYQKRFAGEEIGFLLGRGATHEDADEEEDADLCLVIHFQKVHLTCTCAYPK